MNALVIINVMESSVLCESLIYCQIRLLRLQLVIRLPLYQPTNYQINIDYYQYIERLICASHV